MDWQRSRPARSSRPAHLVGLQVLARALGGAVGLVGRAAAGAGDARLARGALDAAGAAVLLQAEERLGAASDAVGQGRDSEAGRAGGRTRVYRAFHLPPGRRARSSIDCMLPPMKQDTCPKRTLSVCVLLQPLGHTVLLAGQVQALLVQVAPDTHLFPQAPQFSCGSTKGSCDGSGEGVGGGGRACPYGAVRWRRRSEWQRPTGSPTLSLVRSLHLVPHAVWTAAGQAGGGGSGRRRVRAGGRAGVAKKGQHLCACCWMCAPGKSSPQSCAVFQLLRRLALQWRRLRRDLS